MSEIFPNWTQNSIQSINQRTCDEHVHTAVVCTSVKVGVWIFCIRKPLCKKKYMIQNLKLEILANLSVPLIHPAVVHASMQFGDLKSTNPMSKVRTNGTYSCMLKIVVPQLLHSQWKMLIAKKVN